MRQNTGCRGQNIEIEYRTQRIGVNPFILFALFAACCLLFTTARAFAQDEMIAFIEKKQKEIKEKEDALRKEEERLNAIRKDVDERIGKYTLLLNQIDEALKKIEQIRDERLDHVVKAYEAMSAEDAAARLSALDESMAVKIMLRMKGKKAGAVIGLMEPRKAASITEKMAKVVKNFPAR